MDDIDRAQMRETEMREDALQAQQRRAGLTGDSAGYGDSARWCRVCDAPIPLPRRRAVPGVQTCIDCQQDLERSVTHG